MHDERLAELIRLADMAALAGGIVLRPAAAAVLTDGEQAIARHAYLTALDDIRTMAVVLLNEAGHSRPAEPHPRRTPDPSATLEELAAALGVTPNTARAWCRTGRVTGAARDGRQWRIPRPTLNELASPVGQE